MNCPNPKCKKTSLDVSRTFGSPERVYRDRKCSKCGTYYKTIECFVFDVDKNESEFRSELVARDSVIRNLQGKLNEVKSAFQVFMGLLDEKKKR